MAVIQRLPEPPAEIIEVSWSRTQQSLEENLRTGLGDRDRKLAGEWLLALLRDKHFDAAVDLNWCARKAKNIARAADLEEGIYYEFDGLADDIFLAKNNPDGDLAACRRHMEEALAKYPSPPSPGEA